MMTFYSGWNNGTTQTEWKSQERMPTIFREGPYRFFSYASDRNEPPHVHVVRDNLVAKFWLDPVRMQSDGRLRPSEIRRIQRKIADNRELLIEAWNDYFND